MKKLLSILSAVGLMAMSATSVMSMSTAQVNKNNVSKNEYRNLDSINIASKNKLNNLRSLTKSAPEEIKLNSQNSKMLKRVYVNSSSDKSIPYFREEYDKVYAKVEKDRWYYNEFDMVSINILDYANSKTEFLELYKTVQMEGLLGYNFWTSGAYGWEATEGQNFKFDTFMFQKKLKGENDYSRVLYRIDGSHDNREHVQIELKEDWYDNHLRIKARLGARVTWTWGSPYDHAAILGVKHELVRILKRESLIDLRNLSKNKLSY
ncbi:hypothetical protein [Williamsoniiplasma luminosum]|uniref:Superantigen-like protein n=1 Tax=Williamsoniiplasma luminosum TaxID=214888 RepID=A0A2S0NKT2_9MOLU|nr:hypothetical protein [Williamsoniiplasma luminosum]AVP49621.1 MAG: hypothetical protein C5T88_03545 [Williamsoniiplasma luminosum]